MFKTAWILPAVMLVALIIAALFPFDLSAAESNGINWGKPTAQPQTEFKNLPGVATEAKRAEEPEYTCTSDIQEVYRARGDYNILYGDVQPTRVYHCTTASGVTYTGTRMPNTNWVPGLNPHDLPK